MVFFAPSPRNLAFAEAKSLDAQAQGRIAKVGVFVDPTDDLLRDAIAAGSLDALQLHKVTAARRGAVKALFGLPVWAVTAVKTPEDLARHPAHADRVLYDAATPADAALPGGMGVRFDWGLLAGRAHDLKWGLAGGLTPANVADAITLTGAPLVDVSSGVESAPGAKDVDLIRAFCEAARSAG